MYHWVTDVNKIKKGQNIHSEIRQSKKNMII